VEANYTWLLLQMLMALAVVCGLAFVTLKFFLPRMGLARGGPNALLKVIERFPLEPRKSLYLVRIGGGYHLLGVAEHNISYLIALSKDEVDTLLSEREWQRGKGPRTFQEVLASWKGGAKPPTVGKDGTA
jgi:flagellar protein FliO/FliZ